MASTINTNNIDTAYPVAGQDNDSQGFRDNFTNIKTNLDSAKDEIEDLQNKAILKSALVGDTLDNDMAGAPISNALTSGFHHTVHTVNNLSGTYNIDTASADYYNLSLNGPLTISFTNFPGTTVESEYKARSIRVEVTITDTSYTLTLPAEVTIGKDGIQNLVGNTITFPYTGTFVFEFTSIDGGSTIAINDLTRARLQYLASPPANSTGNPGDKAGMIAFDSGYIYLCTADYDGTSLIWIRTAANTF